MRRDVVLITGASRGIGTATAKLFASHNYDVVICYNKEEELAKQVEKEIINEYHVETLTACVDISNEESVKSLINQVIHRFSKIDVLINNAGIAIDTLYQDKSVENFRKTLDINLIGTFLMSKYVGDIMYENKKGSIINLTSTNGLHQYFPMSLDYDSSKAGIISLTHNLAVQYAPHIRVNAVAPGWVATENEMKELDKEYIELEEQNIFIRRFADPLEVAKVIYFLASDDASYINNEVITVDGGTRHA